VKRLGANEWMRCVFAFCDKRMEVGG